MLAKRYAPPSAPFYAFTVPPEAWGVFGRPRGRPGRVEGEGMSAMEQQCNGMAKVEKRFLRVSGVVLCLFFAPITRPYQRIGRNPRGKRGEALELRKRVKKKQCNGMEGGKTRPSCLCCTLSPCRGSFDASPSVELTAERLRHRERPWGGRLGKRTMVAKKKKKTRFWKRKKGLFSNADN